MRQESLPLNFISDLEQAIAVRSNKTGTMLHQITDLFLLNAGHYSADQVALYDGVLELLIARVDVAARELLSKRLAPLDDAPIGTIRSLALDDAIEVAEPVLAQSNLLDDDTLISCITSKGQDHLLAIAARNQISENVSDHLIMNGDKNVLGVLVNNDGAAISEPSFGVLVEKSAGDEWLAEAIARRDDIPLHHFRELVSKASEIVQGRLIAKNPEQSEIIEGIFSRNAARRTSKGQAPVRDYRTAELFVASQPVTEATVQEYAKAKRLEETVVSLAQLSGLSTAEIERLFLSPWTSPVAIILKAIGFRLTTIDAIYRARLPEGGAIQGDLARTKAEFIAVSRPTAERIMRFYRTRRSAEFSGCTN